jgi:arylsulfatase
MESKRGKKAPFFAYITPNAPHAPLDVPEEYAKRYAGKTMPMAAKFYGMIENIDENFGRLLGKLDEWGIAENTLVIFMTDNGGTVGVNIYNAGMRGGKNTPYQGATRVPAFWRWPAGFPGGVDCAALTAHVDVLPTLAEFAGVKLSPELKRQVEGRSLAPLLKNPRAEWANRFLVTHTGRWPRGGAGAAKFKGVSIRDQRFTLVNDSELYDLRNDPGEKVNVIAQHPEMAATLRRAYNAWWESVQPMLVNEGAVGPKVNPFKAHYWKQFGGGPDEELRRVMDPARAGFN